MENEELPKLQKELDALKAQFNSQYHHIMDLQRRIDQLSGKQRPGIQLPAAGSWNIENFIGLRLIHFVGIIVLVIGLSIGVKYAIDRNLISEGLRIILAYLAGLVLYGLSVKLKEKYQGFSAILFSGAMASLYFTTYAAHVYYNMFPFAIAFILMVLLTVYTTWEAVRYNRQEIALLGLVGAYGIPFLISKNADRADLFFLYITVINIGIIYLVIRKLWKNVGIAAQAISWVLFIGWASTRFHLEYRWTGFLFMMLFFFQFAGMLVYMNIRSGKKLEINDGYQLVLNNVALYIGALFIFGIQAEVSPDLDIITLMIAFWVALQALAAAKLLKDEVLLVRMLASLALVLFVMFIAFHWDGFKVTLLWLLTAVIVFVLGFRMRSVRARMAAILLIGLTLTKLLFVDSIVFTTVQKVMAYIILGVLLLVVSFFYQKFRKQLFSEEE